MADLYGTYDKRIKFTIDNTKIDATLTWIPITVLLTSTAGEEVFVELDADTDFDKCAFTKADETTELYADCEKYDVSGEIAIYHVSLDGWEIASGTDTDFYMYYDDDASPNTSKISKSGGTASQSVYDANFKAVYHMNDATDANLPYDTKYEATVEPDDDGWTLGGTDYSSVAGGILTIDTSANDIYTCYYYKTPDVDFDAGFYLKMKVKASTDMDAASDALIFQIQDGTQNQQFKMWIRDGEVSYFHQSNTTVDIAIDTTTAYVTYEIYIKASTFYIYMDGVQKAANTLDAETVTDLVQFGDPLGSPTMCKAEIDYVYYALDIGWNPVLDTNIVDSTSNVNHGTKSATNQPLETAGKIGQAQDNSSVDGWYIDFGDDNSLDITDAITIETTIDNLTTHKAFGRILAKQYDGDTVGEQCYVMCFDAGATKPRFAVGGVFDITSGDALDDETWYYLAGTYDKDAGGSDEAKLYVNATEKVTGDASDVIRTSTRSLGFGQSLGDADANFFRGEGDEIRVSSVARAAAWIKATYESLWDSLLTYGDEETSGVVVDNAIFFGCNF